MKKKGSFMLLFIALLVLGVGYLVFSTTINAIDGTSPQMNATCSNAGTIYSVYPPILMLIAIVAVFSIITWYISTPDRYLSTHKFLAKIVKFLDTTTYYFAFGLAFLAICAVTVVAVYFLYSLVTFAGESGIGLEVGKWALLIVGAYFGIAGVGYLFKKFIWDKYKKTKEEARYKLTMKELPKTT